jgi:lipopolysaccharide export system protein LptA
VTFGAPPPPAGAPAAPPPLSLLNGPQGNLQAERIELILPETGGGRAERLEAYQKVTARVDTRVASGDRLTYFTDDERYLMTGIATVPVQIVDGCRTTTGRSVTFFKSTERIIVDGQEEIRTQSVRGAACSQPAR